MEKVIKSTIALSITGLALASGYLFYQNQKSPELPSFIVPPIKNSQTHSNPNLNQLLQLAEEQTEKQQYQAAIQTYIEAFKLDESSNLALIGIAQVYFESDKQDLVLQNLLNAEKKGPLTYQGKILKLKSNLVKQNLKTATETYSSIPENTSEKLVLGSLINILNGNTNEASNKLNLILKNPDMQSDPDFQLATRLKNALEIFSTFTDSPKSYLLALVGKELLDQNQYILARPLLFAAIQDKNDYRDGWLMLGYSYLLSNNSSDAVKSLERAKQIDPYNPEIYFYLGLAQQKNNQANSAVENFKKASSFGFRNSKDNLIQIANSLYLSKKYSESNEYYLRASQEGTLSIEDYTKLVWINLEQLNNPNQALTSSLEALSAYPTTAMANNLVAWSQIGLQNYSEARKYLDLALSINPNFEAAYLNLGLINLQENNLEEARQNFEKAIEFANQNRAPSIAERATAELNKTY